MNESGAGSWRHEFRDRLAEVEAFEGELERAERSLVDVLVDEGRHGSRLRIETFAGDFEGTVEHVGASLVSVVTPARVVDISLASVTAISITERGDDVRRVTRGHPGSLLSLARELAQRGAAVEIGRNAGLPIVGILEAAGASHLELETVAGPCFVPISAICWLVRTQR